MFFISFIDSLEERKAKEKNKKGQGVFFFYFIDSLEKRKAK